MNRGSFYFNFIVVTFSEHRVRPNNLYQELSFQDNDALGEMDEGADISGNILLLLLL